MIKSVKLGEIARVSSGGTPSRANPSYWNGNIPWVKTTQIQNCVITPQDVDEWITEEGLKNSSAKMVPAGTIVLGMIGQGKTRGQVGYLSFDACTNQNAATITCNNECDSWFIYQYLLFNYENIRALSNSSGQGNLNLGLVEIIPITLPPLSQQKKIANLLGTWDNAIEKTEALIAAKEKQFEWLRSHLISSSQVNQTLKFGDFLTESRIPDTTQDPERRLTVRLHLKGVSVRDYRGTESTDATKYFHRKSGQLIYGKQNVFRGSIGIVPSHLDGYSSSQDIPAFDIADNVNSKWLYWYLSRPSFYSWLENFSAGSGSKRLHPKELFKISVDLPTLEDQKRISDSLNLADKEIRLLKKTLKQYRSQKRGLMQKLLTGEWQVGSTQSVSEGALQELSKEGVA